MAQIEFPILVPDDVPLMDNTQLINYVVEHTCDEMRSVMIDLVYNIDAKVKLDASVRAAEEEISEAIDKVEKALDHIRKAAEDSEA